MDIWSLEIDIVMQSILEHVFYLETSFFQNNIGTSVYLWVLWNKRDFDCDYWVLEVDTEAIFDTIITKCDRTLHGWIINLLVSYIYSWYIPRPSSAHIACVASVSNRVIARKLEREQKKKKTVEGEREGES